MNNSVELSTSFEEKTRDLRFIQFHRLHDLKPTALNAYYGVHAKKRKKAILV